MYQALPKHQRGTSLLEVTLSLGVVLAIAAVVAGGFASTRETARFDAARGEVVAVASAVTQLARASGITSVSARAIAEARLLPDNMIVGSGASTTLVHSFGGQFEVTQQPIPGLPSTAGVRIRMTGLDAGRCADAAIGLAERFDAVVAGGTSVKNRLIATPLLTSRSSARTGCSANSGQLDFFLLP